MTDVSTQLNYWVVIKLDTYTQSNKKNNDVKIRIFEYSTNISNEK